MKKNIGAFDRVARVFIALVVALLYYTGQITDSAAIVLGIIAVILLLTSVVSFCPLYAPFKISTTKKNS